MEVQSIVLFVLQEWATKSSTTKVWIIVENCNTIHMNFHIFSFVYGFSTANKTKKFSI